MLHVKNVQVLSCNSFLLGIDAISFPNDMLLLQYELVPKGILRFGVQEGSALWGNTLTTALLHDLDRTIPFGTIEKQRRDGLRASHRCCNEHYEFGARAVYIHCAVCLVLYITFPYLT